MPQPQREAARTMSVWDLTVEHDDAIFGGWSDNSKDHHQRKRERGIFERLSAIELYIKGIGVALAYLVLHASGVPTETILKAFANLIGHLW